MVDDLENKIYKLIENSLDDIGCRILEVVFKSNKSSTLQVFIDKQDGTSPTLDDCALASDKISILLDVEDFIDIKYNLEISTPGIDRVLVSKEDWIFFVGHKVKVTFNSLINNKIKMKGIIHSIDDDLSIKCDKEIINFKISDIKRAKLIMTDRLINMKNKGN